MAELSCALDAATAPVAFWWRDDDAGRMHDRLEALVRLSEQRRAPLTAAVVPAWLDDEAAARLRSGPDVTVVQHGIDHADHAEPGQKKIELGGSMDRDRLRQALADGRRTLDRAFGQRFLPVLVPPWNRIDAAMVPELSALGFVAWSAFGSRSSATAPRRIDTHLDLVDWRRGRRHLGKDEAGAGLAALVRAGHGEPIGLLSHHLLTDAQGWAVLDALLDTLQSHPAARLVSLRQLLGEG